MDRLAFRVLKKEREMADLKKDPEADMMLAAAGQVFDNLLRGAEKAGAPPKVIENIQKGALEMENYRMQDPLLLMAIDQADTKEAPGSDGSVARLISSWLEELRNRRLSQAYDCVDAAQNLREDEGRCGNCQGCSHDDGEHDEG
jgi:hypothetical protein